MVLDDFLIIGRLENMHSFAKSISRGFTVGGYHIDETVVLIEFSYPYTAMEA